MRAALAIGVWAVLCGALAYGESPLPGPSPEGRELHATSAPATQAGHRPLPPEQARRAANSLVLVTAVGLIAVLAALIVWVVHWGRRLKQQDRWDHEPASREPGPDPWIVSGRRLDQKQEPDQEGKPPSGEESP